MLEAGVGIYGLSDASKLIRVPRRQLKRWLFGYDYSRALDGARKTYHSPPLWRTAFADDAGHDLSIGFADLLEARVVNEFVAHGVHLTVVRKCLQKAREILGADHPFTQTRFCTDGKTIYAEALADLKREHGLLDLHSSQFAFKEVIKPSLYAGIEYRGGRAARWYPLARSKAVVMDPQVQFGKPVVAAAGVPTGAIYSAYLAEGERRAAVAKTFDISSAEVDAALRFELSLPREISSR